MKPMKLKPKTHCVACKTTIPADNWGKHIETKQHHNEFKKFRKRLFIDKSVFDSPMITKDDMLHTFIPRVKWKNSNWNIIKEKVKQ